MNNDFLTVKEFATAANVSTQRIYQLLAKDLQSYCKEENGRKYIHIEALQRFDIEDLQSACKVFTKSLPSNLQEENSKLQSELDVLKAENNSLRDKIADRDKTIERLEQDKAKLNERLDKAETNISNLTTALTAAQALHGMDKQQAVIDMTAVQDQTEPKELAEDPSQQKISWLQRLFGKRSK